MKVSAQGRAALRHHEGVRRKPYLDSVLLWTTGVGHLIAPQTHLKMTLADRKAAKLAGQLQCPIEWNRTLTNDEIDHILETDLVRFERGVLRFCPSIITQGQFNALTSFAFNAGLGALQKSSIRTKHNRGDFNAAADAFLLYRMASGVIQNGLVIRRNDERTMYLSG
jgi:lysozyme